MLEKSLNVCEFQCFLRNHIFFADSENVVGFAKLLANYKKNHELEKWLGNKNYVFKTYSGI